MPLKRKDQHKISQKNCYSIMGTLNTFEYWQGTCQKTNTDLLEFWTKLLFTDKTKTTLKQNIFINIVP